MHRADYHGSTGKWQLLDSDWNLYYVRVSGSFKTELEFRYVADLDQLLALEFVPNTVDADNCQTTARPDERVGLPEDSSWRNNGLP